MDPIVFSSLVCMRDEAIKLAINGNYKDARIELANAYCYIKFGELKNASRKQLDYYGLSTNYKLFSNFKKALANSVLVMCKHKLEKCVDDYMYERLFDKEPEFFCFGLAYLFNNSAVCCDKFGWDYYYLMLDRFNAFLKRVKEQ